MIIEVTCETCSGTGNMTPGGGRNNVKDRCTTCGGRGKMPARTGETAASSWPLAVVGTRPPGTEIVRHIKSGGVYEVMFRDAAIDCRPSEPLHDDEEIIVVRHPVSMTIYVWPAHWKTENWEVIVRGKIQTSVPLQDGDKVVVYVAFADRRVWARRSAEMDDGRFEAVGAVGALETTLPGGEVEELVDNLITATINHEWFKYNFGGRSAKETLAFRKSARTALLAVVRSSGGGDFTKLKNWLIGRCEAAYRDAESHSEGSENRSFYRGIETAYENAANILSLFAPTPARQEEGSRSDGHGLRPSGSEATVPAPAAPPIPEAGSLASQVADQCKVVAHLARALAQVHDDYAKLATAGAFASIINDVGQRSAELMEILGETLNNMDAVSPNDEWTYPVFEAAQRAFPSRTRDEQPKAENPKGLSPQGASPIAESEAPSSIDQDYPATPATSQQRGERS